ncbi:MAG: ribonuclease H-like domain-containing protein [Chloroflexota bacterium]
MKFAAFDIEIAKEIKDGGRWQDAAPLGISCAAMAFSDRDEPVFWQGVPRMTKSECQSMFLQIQQYANEGFTIVTWNGCGFDFAVLADETGMVNECGKMAINHVDLMLIVTFSKGWFLSLDKALTGAGLKGKKKSVTLSNGTVLDEMGGEKAPRLWAAGEQQAVLSYLHDDVVELIKLVKVISSTKKLSWISNRGSRLFVDIPYFKTVKECFDIPEPDVSWMKDAPKRRQFVDWIPAGILDIKKR